MTNNHFLTFIFSLTMATKNLKKKLKKDLMEIKANGIWYDYERTYCDIINLVIEYMNETQDFELEDYTNRYTDEDMVNDYINHIASQYWPYYVSQRLSDLDWTYDYYKIDDVFWDITEMTQSDVEELLDEILDEL